MKAEGILVTWGRNIAYAPLVEPVAAVVTFMAQEKRDGGVEKQYVAKTTAMTEHTAAGHATEIRKGNLFLPGAQNCVMLNK